MVCIYVKLLHGEMHGALKADGLHNETNKTLQMIGRLSKQSVDDVADNLSNTGPNGLVEHLQAWSAPIT